MRKYFLILFAGLVTSLFLFPFELLALPGKNTKMGLGFIGLLICIYKLIADNQMKVPKNVIVTCLLASCMSIACLCSTTYNGTIDPSYEIYLISMSVWFSAAFTVCCIIKKVHGKITVEILCNYLIAVCVFQCFMALFVDSFPELKNFLDTYIEQNQRYLTKVGRLYGLGASVDVAGIRFSACLIILVFLLCRNRNTMKTYQVYLYILSFLIIAIVGNMVARTTTVGVLLSLLYLPFGLELQKKMLQKGHVRILKIFSWLIVLAIPVCWYLYHNNADYHKLFRFAFEAVFNYVEEGNLETASTTTLKSMYVFPDDLKTWIIGDGYFNNPNRTDPYYLGNTTKYGFYMGTDAGYLRFIYYCGVIGLVVFSIFMVYVAKACMCLLPNYRTMFILLLSLSFIIWIKVATDIFLVFALFICVGNMQDIKTNET